MNTFFLAQNANNNNGLGYGLLYNWDVINPNYTGARMIAPQGWRIPTTTDWNTLISYCGGTSLAGGRLKETGYTHWTYPNTNATDLYGFSARGAGNRYVYSDHDDYTALGVTGIFWALPENTTTHGYIYGFHNNDGIITHGTMPKINGASIRFIKNDSVNPGTVSDYDGNIYNTIKIGNQVWTKQNAKVTKTFGGLDVVKVIDYTDWKNATYPAYCYPANDPYSV